MSDRARTAPSVSAGLFLGLVIQLVFLVVLVAGELTRALPLSLVAVFGLAWNSVLVLQTVLDGYVHRHPARSDGGTDTR